MGKTERSLKLRIYEHNYANAKQEGDCKLIINHFNNQKCYEHSIGSIFDSFETIDSFGFTDIYVYTALSHELVLDVINSSINKVASKGLLDLDTLYPRDRLCPQLKFCSDLAY